MRDRGIKECQQCGIDFYSPNEVQYCGMCEDLDLDEEPSLGLEEIDELKELSFEDND